MKRKYSPCAHKIVKASNDKLTLDEAEDILSDINSSKEKLNARGYDDDSAVSKAVNDFFEQDKINRDAKKLATLQNLKIYKQNLFKTQSLIDDGVRVDKALQALFVGIESPIAGTRNSIDLYKESLTGHYAGRFLSKLEQENLLPILASGEFTKPIVRDLWELSYNRKPLSKNPQVKRIAEIIYEMQGDMKNRMNKAGANIRHRQGFVISQSHDRDLLRKAGFAEWKNFVMSKLDIERSFLGNVDAKEIEETLKIVYEDLITGIRKSALSEIEENFYQATTVNLAKKRSQSRQIIFKNADDFLAYNEKFGRSNFNETLEMSIRAGANDIALLEKMGTNPEAFAEKLVNTIKENNRSQIAGGQKFNEALLQDQINQITGAADFSVNQTYTNITNGIKAYNNVRFLGRALASQITDIPLKSLEYKFQGRNLLSSFLQTFNDLKSNITNIEDQKRFASLTGVFAEQFIGDINSKISGGRDLLQKANRVQRLFFKLNGMRLWDSTSKTSMAKTMAHDLGLVKDRSFGELDEITQRIMQNYDIGEAEWDVIRKSSQTIDGLDYIVAAGVEDQEISNKLAMYFIDRVNHAIPTSTGSTKSIMRFGTKRGTIAGETLELMMQFKSFMFAHVEKVWGRELYARGKADYASMAQLMLATTVFGYLAMTLKDIAKGKTAKDPMKWDTIAASVVQGGGLSIAGDLFFVDYGYGQDLTDIAIGPTGGSINELYKLGQSVMKGDDAKAQAFRVGVGMIPFNNLFYVREPLNQILLYQIQEHLNPGYLARQERRMRESYGQEFLFR